MRTCIECGSTSTPKWYSGPKCRKCYRRKWNKEYKAKDPDRWRRHHAEYMRNRAKIDVQFLLGCNLRSRLTHAVKGRYKSGSAVKDLGCSMKEFIAHIESLWTEGMTWDNYSREGWHIDHVIPLSAFDLTDPDQLKTACHYSNLQPLWRATNLSKGASFS